MRKRDFFFSSKETYLAVCRQMVLGTRRAIAVAGAEMELSMPAE